MRAECIFFFAERKFFLQLASKKSFLYLIYFIRNQMERKNLQPQTRLQIFLFLQIRDTEKTSTSPAHLRAFSSATARKAQRWQSGRAQLWYAATSSSGRGLPHQDVDTCQG